MKLEELVRMQLAVDLDMEPSDFLVKKNYFNVGVSNFNKRSTARSFGMILCRQNQIYCRIEDEALLSELEEEYGQCNGEWFSEVSNLLHLADIVKKYEAKIVNCAPFLIPRSTVKQCISMNVVDRIQDITPRQVQVYKNDPLAEEAFLFDYERGEQFGCAYQVDSEIVALAGTNADGRNSWELGISVASGYQGRGIAAELIKYLTNKLLQQEEDCAFPFYTTQFSHVQSLNVALNAGYKIGWTEIQIEKSSQ